MPNLLPTHLNIMFNPKFAVPTFGYMVPPLACVVVLINICMIWILTRQNMRSPANILLVCVALSDTLAILIPVPCFVYFYTLGNYQDFVPFTWCRMFFNCVHVFPLLCNMASLWATVALAFMRCYSVWRPLKAKSTITIRRTFVVVIVVYVLSTLVYTPLMFEYSYTQLSTESMVVSNSSITTCHMQKNHFHFTQTICSAHTWIQIIFTSLLPWFLISFPNFGLLWKLRQADEERNALNDGCVERLQKERSSSATGHKGHTMSALHRTRTRRTTLVICVIVTIVWLVEIPFGITFTRYLSHSSGDVMRNSLGDSVVFVFLLKYITYPGIFLIYCFMSEKFRHTFRECIFCYCKGTGRSYNMKHSSSSAGTTIRTSRSID